MDVRLTRVEPVTVSLAAFYRLAYAYFCKGEVEERSNTGVLQVMRQEKTENYYL